MTVAIEMLPDFPTNPSRGLYFVMNNLWYYDSEWRPLSSADKSVDRRLTEVEGAVGSIGRQFSSLSASAIKGRISPQNLAQPVSGDGVYVLSSKMCWVNPLTGLFSSSCPDTLNQSMHIRTSPDSATIRIAGSPVLELTTERTAFFSSDIRLPHATRLSAPLATASFSSVEATRIAGCADGLTDVPASALCGVVSRCTGGLGVDTSSMSGVPVLCSDGIATLPLHGSGPILRSSSTHLATEHISSDDSLLVDAPTLVLSASHLSFQCPPETSHDLLPLASEVSIGGSTTATTVHNILFSTITSSVSPHPTSSHYALSAGSHFIDVSRPCSIALSSAPVGAVMLLLLHNPWGHPVCCPCSLRNGLNILVMSPTGWMS